MVIHRFPSPQSHNIHHDSRRWWIYQSRERDSYRTLYSMSLMLCLATIVVGIVTSLHNFNVRVPERGSLGTRLRPAQCVHCELFALFIELSTSGRSRTHSYTLVHLPWAS